VKSLAEVKRVRFSIKAQPDSEWYVAGTFNSWNPKKHKLRFANGVHSAYGLLRPGRHEYKFVINDRWQSDPECRDWAPDGHGSLNSVIEVN